MNPDFLHALPAWATWLFLAAHLAGGLALGLLYFHGLRWNLRLFAGGRGLAAVIALAVGRFALLAALLAWVSLEGAGPLLAAALGIFIARFVAVRSRPERMRERAT